MTDNYQVLIKGSETIQTVVAYVEGLVGTPFIDRSDVGWPLYDARVMKVDISIRESDFENCQGIEFESYNYYIEITPAAKYMLKVAEYEALFDCFPTMIASGVSCNMKCECAVVDSLQLLVKVFALGMPGSMTTPYY